MLTDLRLSGDNVSCSLGWGDFGPRGLEDLIRSHQCSDICEELALRPKEEMLEDFFAKQKSVAEAEQKLQDAECAYGELTAVHETSAGLATTASWALGARSS